MTGLYFWTLKYPDSNDQGDRAIRKNGRFIAQIIAGENACRVSIEIKNQKRFLQLQQEAAVI